MTLLGIDAGGSKTRIVRADDRSALHEPSPSTESPETSDLELTSMRFPGVNIADHGIERLSVVLDDLPKQLAIEDPETVEVYGGFAGLQTDEHAKQVTEVFAQHGYSPENIHVVNDGKLWLASLQQDGIVLALGTGSVCVAQIEGRLYQTGGYGYLLGDEASGFYLGKRGLNLAIHMSDHRGNFESDAILRAALEHFNVDRVEGFIDKLYGPAVASTRTVASFAPKVLELADVAEDPEAKKIVIEAGILAAEHIQGICKQAQILEAVVGLTGGIFDSRHNALLKDEMKFYLELAGLELSFIELGEGEGKQDPLIRAMYQHFIVGKGGQSG